MKFLEFTLDAERCSLLAADRDIKLRPKTFDVLHFLLQNAGRLVRREELIGTVWPNVIVNEESVTQCVSELRQALGDREHNIIKTIARRGYLFAVPVEQITNDNEAEKSRAAPPSGPASLSMHAIGQESEQAARRCAKCDVENSYGANTCRECGEPLPMPEFSQSRAAQERRPLTVLFCGLAGSTECAASLDPEDLSEVISGHHARIRDVIASHGGFVARYQSDGVLAYFGYPRANESDAERAIGAGLAVVEAVGRLKDANSTDLVTRIGIATSLVVVGNPGGDGADIVGAAPSLAHGLSKVAEPGGVLIAASTQALVKRLFEYRDLGALELAGSTDPVRALQVVGASEVASRFEALRHPGSSLIGRQEELDLLLRRWHQAKTGEGRVVLITGEPGIGKSKLVLTVQERFRSEAHTLLPYYCSPNHQASALYPIIRQLLKAAGIEREDSDETKRTKLKALVAPTAEKFAEDVALLAALLSIPGGDRLSLPTFTPQRLRQLTLRVLLDHLKRLTLRGPVLMVFEDLQWIDPTSLDLLALAIEQLAGLPILLLATYRPEFAPCWPPHQYISTLSLTRLGRSEGKALVENVTNGKNLPAEILDQIIVRTDGVPLFIEELTKSLVESGMLCDAGDRYELAAPLPQLTIPSSLHASLLARLDRLDTPAKDAAQVGAVVGRTFSYNLIKAVSDVTDQALQAGLAQLVKTELIFQRGVAPESTYVFKHALVRDAVYASLLRGRRKKLHDQIARALEDHFPDVGATEPETLAHHFTEAGLTEPAIDSWRRAGERALIRFANAEAVKHLTKGIDLLHTLPLSLERNQKELALRMPLGPATMALNSAAAPESLQVFSRARELLNEAATLTEQMNVLMGLWISHDVRGQHREANEVAHECLSLATRHQDLGAAARANRFIGFTHLMMGAPGDARRHFELTLDLCAKGQKINLHFLDDDRVHALSALSRALWHLGYPEQAAAAASQALVCAQTVTHAITTAYAFLAQAILGSIGGDPERAMVFADRGLALCDEFGIADWRPWARFAKGDLLARRGEPQLGISFMRSALTELERTGAKLGRAMRLGCLAAAHMSLGQFDVGLGLLDEAIRTAEQTQEREYEAELHRLRADVLLASGKRREAETELQRALTVARGQEARFWELRAATSLARLWLDRGRYLEARDLLSPIYGWFSEGFELHDLKQAKSLLDELMLAARR